jgi:mono/diheme cytochrome c family protein
MIRTLLVAVLAPLVFVVSGCDDLGKCTDPQNGRVPVFVDQRIQYAGQAIMNKACASCHGSNATGGVRVGAPKGLDFDLVPLEATSVTMVGGETVGTTDNAALMSGLRRRQRKVFDLRELIWEQVDKGLMPPSGVGDGFKNASPGKKVAVMGGGNCTFMEPGYGGVNSGATKKALKQWLACGAPIVEMNSPMIPKPVGGTVGDQYPSCKQDLEPTFDNIYNMVLKGNCAIQGCHTAGAAGAGGFDLGDIDLAYMEMLGDGSGAASSCNGAKMVVPGKPEESYLLAKLGYSGTPLTKCGIPMPPTGMLPEDTLQLIADWIMAGADPAGGGGGGAGDADGGT